MAEEKNVMNEEVETEEVVTEEVVEETTEEVIDETVEDVIEEKSGKGEIELEYSEEEIIKNLNFTAFSDIWARQNDGHKYPLFIIS